MTITFHAMENRTQVVTSSAVILNSDGNPLKALPDQTFQLSAGSNLPWEANESLSWNGIPTDGIALAGGQYQLVFSIIDGDGNVSPSTSTKLTIGGGVINASINGLQEAVKAELAKIEQRLEKLDMVGCGEQGFTGE